MLSRPVEIPQSGCGRGGASVGSQTRACVYIRRRGGSAHSRCLRWRRWGVRGVGRRGLGRKGGLGRIGGGGGRRKGIWEDRDQEREEVIRQAGQSGRRGLGCPQCKVGEVRSVTCFPHILQSFRLLRPFLLMTIGLCAFLHRTAIADNLKNTPLT